LKKIGRRSGNIAALFKLLANDRAVHAVGIESTRALTAVVDNVENLGGSAWDAQGIGAGNVVGEFSEKEFSESVEYQENPPPGWLRRYRYTPAEGSRSASVDKIAPAAAR
jgi:hypothetical protein